MREVLAANVETRPQSSDCLSKMSLVGAAVLENDNLRIPIHEMQM